MTAIQPVTTPSSIGQPAIVVIRNPLKPEIVDHEFTQEGLSVAECLKDQDLTSYPTLVLLNARPILEADWEDTHIQWGDVITLVREPGALFATVGAAVVFWVMTAITVITTAYALYTILTMDMPDPGEDRNSPNYSVTYRGNNQRPGEPIPIVYGELRVFPDYSGRYSTYINNDQWLYQLFEIGMGEFEEITADQVYYEDTPLVNFTEYTVEHVPPGEWSNIFPSNVQVSSEVDRIELENAEFTPYYSVNGLGTTITEITFDIVAPQGMYRLNDKGSYRVWHVDVQLSWRDADTLTGFSETVRIGYSKKAARHSFSYVIPEGRYEARVRRMNADDPYSDVVDTVQWEGVRGTEPEKSVTETTRVAIKVRASQTLGNASLSKMNVLVQRKIPVWNGSSWSEPQFTKSAAWAFADACRADYGGKNPDSKIDLDQLLDIDSRGVEFNGVFDSKTTLWDALNEIARVFNGRAVEKPGGVLSIATDDEGVAPSAMYTMRNIVKDSFGIEHNFPPQETVNFVRVTFKNKLENYRETSVDCVPYGIVPEDPYEVNLRGVTDRDVAYDIGLRLANESRWRRKRVAFETGIEGFIPSAYDTIRVAHYQIGLEQTVDSVSGEVKSNAGNTLTVFEDLSHLQGQGSLQCYLKDKDGSPWGPVGCSVGEHTISLFSTPPSGVLVYGDDHAGPLYAVGQTADFMMLCKVTKVMQTGEHTIQIEAIEDNPNAYIGDQPPEYSSLLPPFDIAPIVSNLQAALVGSDDDFDVRLIWQGQYADYYIVEMSDDNGNTWAEMDRPRNSNSQIPVPYLDGVLIQVKGVSTLVGAPVQVLVNVKSGSISYPGIHNLRPLAPFEGPQLTVAWDPTKPGENVLLEFIARQATAAGSPVLHDIRLPSTTTQYTLTMDMIMSRISRTIGTQRYPVENARYVSVVLTATAKVDGAWEDSPQSSEIVVVNDQMGPPYNVIYREKNRTLDLQFDWPDTDYSGVEVHLSESSGFTPNDNTLKYRGPSNNIAINEVLDYPETYYLKMAAYDIFGPDDDMLWSNQETISTTDDSFSGDVDWDQINDPKPPIDADKSSPVINHDPNFDQLNGSGGDWDIYWERSNSSQITKWSDGSGINGVEIRNNWSNLDLTTVNYYEITEGAQISVRVWGQQTGMSDPSQLEVRLLLYRGNGTLLRDVEVANFGGFPSSLDEVCFGFYRVPKESSLANTPRTFRIRIRATNSLGGDYIYIASVQAIFGGYVEWQDVLDSEGKPVDNADVTKDNLGGDGVNRIPPAYAAYWAGQEPPPMRNAGGDGVVFKIGSEGTGVFGSARLRVGQISGTDYNIYFADHYIDDNIKIEPNSRWIFSAWVCADNSGAAYQRGYFRLRSDSGGHSVAPKNIKGFDDDSGWFTYGGAGVWKELIGWFDLTNYSYRETTLQCRRHPTGSNQYVGFDGLFLERMRSDHVPTLEDWTGFKNAAGRYSIPTSHLVEDAVQNIYVERLPNNVNFGNGVAGYLFDISIGWDIDTDNNITIVEIRTETNHNIDGRMASTNVKVNSGTQYGYNCRLDVLLGATNNGQMVANLLYMPGEIASLDRIEVNVTLASLVRTAMAENTYVKIMEIKR